MQTTLARMTFDVNRLHKSHSPLLALYGFTESVIAFRQGADFCIRWSPPYLQVKTTCRWRNLTSPGNCLLLPLDLTWCYLEDRCGQAGCAASNSEWPHCDTEPSKIQRNGPGIPFPLQKPRSCDPYTTFCKASFCRDHLGVYLVFVVER